MADDRYLGITFPFEEDLKGKYLKLDKVDKDNIKSNLTNLLTTVKGERLFRPDFGTNLMQYLYQPMDEQTYNEIKQEIFGAVSKYLRQIEIRNVKITEDKNSNFVGFTIDYTISDGVFKEQDKLSVLL